MSFLAEMLAVATVWLSSFALGQFGVAIEHHACPKMHGERSHTVARSPHIGLARPAPIAVNAPRAAPHDA